MHAVIAAAIAAFLVGAQPASAQGTTGLETGRFGAWVAIGFQGDLGGSLNRSGTGLIDGFIGEINANTWGERYDAGLLVRYGFTYDLTDTVQVTLSGHWEQAEADDTEVGLLGGRPLSAAFDDYQGWGLDFGGRHFFATTAKAKPFVGISLGVQRIQEIGATLSAPDVNFIEDNVPFYDDSWVTQWRFGTGFLWSFTERLGLQVALDLKYSGVLSDQAGLGTLGFDRINDTGNRWTLPLTGGVYFKF
jgi:hypothetical protein